MDEFAVCAVGEGVAAGGCWVENYVEVGGETGEVDLLVGLGGVSGVNAGVVLD